MNFSRFLTVVDVQTGRGARGLAPTPTAVDMQYANPQKAMARNPLTDGARPRHPLVTDEMLDPGLRGPLGLSAQQIAATVAFMKTLTDPGTALDPCLLAVPDRVPSEPDASGLTGPGRPAAARCRSRG
jgi:hypothetical protein